MNQGKAIASLNSLRADFMGKLNSPFFAEKTEWVSGVVKGIDLAIGVIATHERLAVAREEAPQPQSCFWPVVLTILLSGAVFAGLWWTGQH